MRRNNYRRENRSNEIKNKSGYHLGNSLAYPFELYCFAESTRMTIIIEPQAQFMYEKGKDMKNESLEKSKKNSRLNSTFISRKNSMESSNISKSF